MHAAFETINTILGVATYFTWLLGTQVFKGMRIIHPLFFWLWIGYSIIYAGDVVAIGLGIRYEQVYQDPRLVCSRSLILFAAWRSLWRVLHDILHPGHNRGR